METKKCTYACIPFAMYMYTITAESGNNLTCVKLYSNIYRCEDIQLYTVFIDSADTYHDYASEISSRSCCYNTGVAVSVVSL